MRSLRWTIGMALLFACGSPEAPVTPRATPVVEPTPTPKANPVTSWHPLLYRIDGAKPSYLFGTVHVPDPRLATFPRELDEALSNANEVVGELAEVGGAATAGAFVLPPEKSLATELPPALYERLKKTYEARGLGAMFPVLQHAKVWVVAVQVSSLGAARAADAGAPGLPVDAVVLQRAKAQGKPVRGLETPADQLAIFDGLTRDEQVRMLEQRLDQRDEDARAGSDRGAKLMDAFVAGSEAPLLAQLDAAFDLTKALDKKLHDRLITDRNAKLTDGIVAMTSGHAETSYFFAIGAAHLLGDDGIVARLRKRGFHVERVAHAI